MDARKTPIPTGEAPRRRRRRRLRLGPPVGRRLPAALRPRRVDRLTAALPGGVDDPGFPALLSRIDASPVHAGNRLQPFFDGRQAFAAMLEAIAAAAGEILVESYILRDDDTGERFLTALAAAAARGVAVRVLADALGSSETGGGFWERMRAADIGVHLFHPLFPYFWWELVRDHRKILVVDRRVGFTGGMNIGDEYGSRHSSGPWRDTHVRVEGPAVAEMAVVFSEGWTRAGGDSFSVAMPPPDAPPAGDSRVLVLDSRPHRGNVEAAAVLAAIVGAARRTVWVTNAYFAPRRIALDVFGRAVDRGVDVRLLLPGPTDVPLVRHAGHGYFRGLLARGVRIWEYQAAVLHAKTLVADGAVTVVGSSNLDFRSFQFNAECNLVVLDRTVGGAFVGAFAADLERATEIDLAAWRARPWNHRLGDRAARLLSPLL
jgi:cardiolipin synthase A/B